MFRQHALTLAQALRPCCSRVAYALGACPAEPQDGRQSDCGRQRERVPPGGLAHLHVRPQRGLSWSALAPLSWLWPFSDRIAKAASLEARAPGLLSCAARARSITSRRLQEWSALMKAGSRRRTLQEITWALFAAVEHAQGGAPAELSNAGLREFQDALIASSARYSSLLGSTSLADLAEAVDFMVLVKECGGGMGAAPNALRMTGAVMLADVLHALAARAHQLLSPPGFLALADVMRALRVRQLPDSALLRIVADAAENSELCVALTADALAEVLSTLAWAQRSGKARAPQMTLLSTAVWDAAREAVQERAASMSAPRLAELALNLQVRVPSRDMKQAGGWRLTLRRMQVSGLSSPHVRHGLAAAGLVACQLPLLHRQGACCARRSGAVS